MANPRYATPAQAAAVEHAGRMASTRQRMAYNARLRQFQAAAGAQRVAAYRQQAAYQARAQAAEGYGVVRMGMVHTGVPISSGIPNTGHAPVPGPTRASGIAQLMNLNGLALDNGLDCGCDGDYDCGCGGGSKSTGIIATISDKTGLSAGTVKLVGLVAGVMLLTRLVR